MGGNSLSHLSEEDEGGGVRFVQGIRLSDGVIDRMRQSSHRHNGGPPATPVPTPFVEHLPPPQTQEAPSTPLSVEPVKRNPLPPVKFHSLATPPPNLSAPPRPPSTPSLVEPVSPLPEPFVPPPPAAPSTPPATELVAKPIVPPPTASAPSESSASSLPSEHAKPAPLATVEAAAVAPTLLETVVPSGPSVQAPHPPPAFESTASAPVIPPCSVYSAAADALPLQVEPIVPPVVAPAVDSPPPCEVFAPPSERAVAPVPAAESSLPHHFVELAIVPSDASVNETLAEPLAPPPPDPLPPAAEPTSTPSFPPVEDEVFAAVPPPAAEVLEEKLRQKIKEEMQRRMEEEINQKRQQLQRQLEDVRAQAQAEAKAAAQAQVEEQVKKTLAAEKAAYTENLTDSIMKERMKTEDERVLVQLYWMELKAQQLEDRVKDLKKREALYKEHVTKLEAKCAEFYKVTAESFQKGKEETLNRFALFNIQPVCGDLQSQILNCYKENTGRTLSCSRIASAYMQCVDNAKKNKMSTGG